MRVLRGEAGRELSRNKNQLYLVGAKCCLTFHYLHVMIYAQKLSVSPRHGATSRPYLMVYQLPTTLVSCELNLTRHSADVSTVTPSSSTSLDLSVCGSSHVYCSGRQQKFVVPGHGRTSCSSPQCTSLLNLTYSDDEFKDLFPGA